MAGERTSEPIRHFFVANHSARESAPTQAMFVMAKSLVRTVQTTLPGRGYAFRSLGDQLQSFAQLSLSNMAGASMGVDCLVVRLEVFLLKAARQSPKAAN